MSHIRMLVVATTFLFSTSVLAAGAEDLAADAALHEIVSSSVPHPVAYWSFDQWDGAEPTGDAKLENVGPTLPEFPDFGEVNAALMLKQSAYAVIPDEGPASRFDFDQGDEITIEAWVSLDSMAENAYIIGKGRTGDGDNQNWALRLRSRSGAACVNFLFRSRDVPAEGDNAARPGDWHRWTSKKGFAPGSGWHHVAVTYTFGEPDSIRGYLDGEEVSGAWDMGGATADPPVVDDDAIWIGAAMKGAKSNALDGAIDELAVYRGVLPPEILKSRFRYVPQPPVRPQVPDDKVLVQLYGPISGIASVPQRVGTLLTEWEQVPWAFVRLPNRYDEWGIRDDWGKTLLVRAWGTVELPEGECQLLVRSRGYSRLWIDGQELATTPAQANRSGAHHVVDPLPEVPVEGMRPAAMADRESLVDFRSDGGRHELLWEIIVGGPSFRAEFGETSLSIARGGEMFHVIDAQLLRPLTDMGWTSLAAELQHDLDEQDIATRRAANRRLEPYWHERHEYAIANLKKSRGDMLSIDDVIARKGQRLDHSQAERARDLTDSQMQSESARYFSEHIETIFASQCYRCHGEKKKSGMNLKEHDRLLTGGDSGTAAIVPGEPDASYLVELVSAPEDAGRMPPKGNGLSASEIEKLREWIRLGGDLPQDDVEPVAATEKVDDLTFLRRLYLDTIGMAPTYGEVTEFLAADERRRRQVWIDRLLDDPRTADNWVGYWQDVLAE
ncbi:MAG: DUF1549 domain-containing protein, partial [Planctomycetales bacterium]|nr:DUF1549 domain-containing protein [Planctomycetales bacterium]